MILVLFFYGKIEFVLFFVCFVENDYVKYFLVYVDDGDVFVVWIEMIENVIGKMLLIQII